jgi:hypothetical protein
MHNLRLSGPPLASPEAVVRWLGAVQSQDYGPGKWSVSHRTVGVDDADMDRLFAEGAILRTHVLRPTWHFVLPEDIRWLLALTGPRVQVTNAHRYRQLELDGATLTRSTARLVRALQDGRHLTRKELATTLESDGINTDGQRLAYILMNAELNGVICSGPLKGKQHTYALLDERALRAKRLSGDEALAELTLRYFTSHGPATAKDFRWWSSLTATEIKRGLEMVAPKLLHQVFDGVSYWFAPSVPHPPPMSPTARLVQAYDEYIVGYSESKYVLDLSGQARWMARVRPVFNGVVILDSQVAGYWRRTQRKDAVLIEAALHTPFDEAQTRALHAAAEGYGAFLGLAARVVTTAA